MTAIQHCPECASHGTLAVDHDRGLLTCRSCGYAERSDVFFRCPKCRGRIKTTQTARGGDWKIQKQTCLECSYRHVSQTKVIATASTKFRRGKGFHAILKKLRGQR